MKRSERKQVTIEKTEKRDFYVLSVNEMFKIRGGGDNDNDNGKLK
jgi:hypothetical protein